MPVKEKTAPMKIMKNIAFLLTIFSLFVCVRVRWANPLIQNDTNSKISLHRARGKEGGHGIDVSNSSLRKNREKEAGGQTGSNLGWPLFSAAWKEGFVSSQFRVARKKESRG